MKIVLDTNVLVSSFFGGNPRRIIRLWQEGSITICLSGPILDEYVVLLERLGLRDSPEAGELLALLRHAPNVLFAKEPRRVHVVKADPADDKFIACATDLGAACIVSGDKHLLASRDTSTSESFPQGVRRAIPSGASVMLPPGCSARPGSPCEMPHTSSPRDTANGSPVRMRRSAIQPDISAVSRFRLTTKRMYGIHLA